MGLAPIRAILAVVGLAPWALPFARAYLPLGRAGVVIDALFATACHRIPERSLVLAGVAMPLCSRCAGIFGGMALGAIAVWPKARPRAYKLALTAAGALMLADVIAQDLGVHPLWHTTRLVTGVAFGYALGAGIVRWLEDRRYFLMQNGRHS